MKPTLPQLCLALFVTPAMAYESIHEKTPVGEIVVLELPARIAIETGANAPYFESNGKLFGKLFRFIDSNEISMTTPVEAEIEPGKMRFFVGSKDKAKAKELRSNQEVKVIRMEPRTVVSIGIRGSYTEHRFHNNEEKLRRWLEDNPEYIPTGEAYAVYWNSPFVPGIIKRSEVHIPVTKGE
jgi:hypothetical protein